MATKKNTESEQVEAITEETIAEEPKPVAKKPRARKAENAPKEEEGFGAEEVPMAENEGEPLKRSCGGSQGGAGEWFCPDWSRNFPRRLCKRSDRNDYG